MIVSPDKTISEIRQSEKSPDEPVTQINSVFNYEALAATTTELWAADSELEGKYRNVLMYLNNPDHRKQHFQMSWQPLKSMWLNIYLVPRDQQAQNTEDPHFLMCGLRKPGHDKEIVFPLNQDTQQLVIRGIQAGDGQSTRITANIRIIQTKDSHYRIDLTGNNSSAINTITDRGVRNATLFITTKNSRLEILPNSFASFHHENKRPVTNEVYLARQDVHNHLSTCSIPKAQMHEAGRYLWFVDSQLVFRDAGSLATLRKGLVHHSNINAVLRRVGLYAYMMERFKLDESATQRIVDHALMQIYHFSGYGSKPDDTSVLLTTKHYEAWDNGQHISGKLLHAVVQDRYSRLIIQELRRWCEDQPADRTDKFIQLRIPRGNQLIPIEPKSEINPTNKVCVLIKKALISKLIQVNYPITPTLREFLKSMNAIISEDDGLIISDFDWYDIDDPEFFGSALYEYQLSRSTRKRLAKKVGKFEARKLPNVEITQEQYDTLINSMILMSKDSLRNNVQLLEQLRFLKKEIKSINGELAELDIDSVDYHELSEMKDSLIQQRNILQSEQIQCALDLKNILKSSDQLSNLALSKCLDITYQVATPEISEFDFIANHLFEQFSPWSVLQDYNILYKSESKDESNPEILPLYVTVYLEGDFEQLRSDLISEGILIVVDSDGAYLQLGQIQGGLDHPNLQYAIRSDVNIEEICNTRIKQWLCCVLDKIRNEFGYDQYDQPTLLLSKPKFSVLDFYDYADKLLNT